MTATDSTTTDSTWLPLLLLLSIPLLLSSGVASATPATAGPPLADRYFLSGDGVIDLRNAKTGASERIRYREADGQYPQTALRRVDRIFGIPSTSTDTIALRLVSLLDYIEDTYRKPIVVQSGYRSPEYNAGLRAKGRLAAKASLHMEGMAADIVLGQALAVRAFEEMKALECCGVGYYHGESLHVDTGPSRYWDETSSKVDTDISSQNKRVMLRTDRDIYRPGEPVTLHVARITEYPIGIAPQARITRNGATVGTYPLPGSRDCLPIAHPEDRRMRWHLPAGFEPEGRLHIELDFCDRTAPEMPQTVESNPFMIEAR
jgi:uncharacterized protein YcbK (DUF882 family)